MNKRNAAILLSFAAVALPLCAADSTPVRPRSGKTEIMRLNEIKPGMKGTAWTVFQGTEPEPVPVEIIGRLKNIRGPNQDVILAKMGGKAARTNVAGGMSGSPVYIDGKLIGAIALRISVFSPDAICGITPIELMLEINDDDQSRPEDARTPDKPIARNREVNIPGDMLSQVVSAGAGGNFPQTPSMVPIESPLVFSGFPDNTIHEFGPLFQQMGIVPVQGGSAGAQRRTTKPVAGWEHSLNPGDMVAGVLVDGDISVTGMGTVTYNDGKRVLAFGHAFLQPGADQYAHEQGGSGDDAGVVLPAEQDGQRHRYRGRAPAGPPQRHHGRAGRHLRHDSGDPERPLARRQRGGDQGKGFPLQRVRASEVDALPDDAHAVQLPFAVERVRRRGHLPAQRRRGTERPAEDLAFHHAGLGRNAHARADGAGRLVGRTLQPPLPEQRQDPRPEGA